MDDDKMIITQEKYDKINEYFNKFLLEFDKEEDSFFRDSLLIFVQFSDVLKRMYSRTSIKLNSNQTKVSFVEILEIVNSFFIDIDKKNGSDYHSKFVDLVNNGDLRFDFDSPDNLDRDSSSYCAHNNNHIWVNIAREHNYDDAVTLVHEFLHYTNVASKDDWGHSVFTEAISIYFETQFKKYLLDKGISNDEFTLFDRIGTTLKSSNVVSQIFIHLDSFIRFGNLNDSSYDDIIKYNLFESKETYVGELNTLYDNIIKLEKNAGDDEEKILHNMHRVVSNYRYVIGTILACYFIKYKDFKSINELNKKIANPMYEPYELFKELGIDFEEINEGFRKHDLPDIFFELINSIPEVIYEMQSVEKVDYKKEKEMVENTESMKLVDMGDIDISSYDKKIIGTQGLGSCMAVVLYDSSKQKTIFGHIITGRMENPSYQKEIQEKIASLLVSNNMLDDMLDLKIIDGYYESNIEILNEDGDIITPRKKLEKIIREILGIKIKSIEYKFNNSEKSNKDIESVDYAFDSSSGIDITNDVYFGERYIEINNKKR